jgi:hypothetical protein
MRQADVGTVFDATNNIAGKTTEAEQEKCERRSYAALIRNPRS